MAAWKDVRRIALALPETVEHGDRGHPAWAVRGKVFAWERPLRPADLRALGERAPRGAILCVRVEHLLAKEARLAAQPEVCFTTPHFDGYPSVLVRLGKIRVRDLEELLVEGWRARAPRRLANSLSPHSVGPAGEPLSTIGSGPWTPPRPRSRRRSASRRS